MPTPEEIALELTNLTAETLSGVGVFDTLMRSAKLHLEEEYTAQRITGHEYATVYLGALTAVLQTSAQFIVNVQQTQLINAQVGQVLVETTRISAEISKLNAEVLATEANTLNATNKVAQEILLMQSQVINDTARTANDTDKTVTEIAAIEARSTADTLKTAAEITAMEANTINSTNKVDSEILLMTAQRTNDTTRTANDTTRTNNETSKVTTENSALAARNAAEVLLLNQKTATELASVSDTIPVGVAATSGTVAGTIAAQKVLYTAQADGFARDAEQKLAKIVADTWSVQKSMNDNVNPDSAGLSSDQIKAVLDKARAGIGLEAAVSIVV